MVDVAAEAVTRPVRVSGVQGSPSGIELGQQAAFDALRERQPLDVRGSTSIGRGGGCGPGRGLTNLSTANPVGLPKDRMK
jgi:hypothetical protein